MKNGCYRLKKLTSRTPKVFVGSFSFTYFAKLNKKTTISKLIACYSFRGFSKYRSKVKAVLEHFLVHQNI